MTKLKKIRELCTEIELLGPNAERIAQEIYELAEELEGDFDKFIMTCSAISSKLRDSLDEIEECLTLEED